MGRLPIRIRCRGRAVSLSGSVASAFRSCITLSLSLSPSPPLSRVFRFPSRPFPSTTVITAFFKADDFQLSGDLVSRDRRNRRGWEGNFFLGDRKLYIIRNWGGIWTFIDARITWNLNPSTNKIGSDQCGNFTSKNRHCVRMIEMEEGYKLKCPIWRKLRKWEDLIEARVKVIGREILEN